MRWNPKPKPTLFSWRIVKKFAWLPVLIDLPKKQYVWLEYYQINQQYDLGVFGLNWINQTKAVNKYWSKR